MYEWLLCLDRDLLFFLSEEFVLQVREEAFALFFTVFLYRNLLNLALIYRTSSIILAQNRTLFLDSLVLDHQLLALLHFHISIEQLRDQAAFDAFRPLRCTGWIIDFARAEAFLCVRDRFLPPWLRSRGGNFGINLRGILREIEGLGYGLQAEAAVARRGLHLLRTCILHHDLVKELRLLLFFDHGILAREQSAKYFLISFGDCILLHFALNGHRVQSAGCRAATHHHLLPHHLHLGLASRLTLRLLALKA